MSRKLKIYTETALALFFLAGVSCNNPERTAFEFMPNMVDSQAVKAQEEVMRLPPEGTYPRGFKPYPYGKEEGELASTELENPLKRSKNFLKLGQKKYNTYCIVCHGPTGKGNGTIVPKFPMPPSLNSDKVREWSDGRLFHVITRGQNLMPSYAIQVTPEERWAIVHYVRALQRSVHPTAEDVEAFKKAVKNK